MTAVGAQPGHLRPARILILDTGKEWGGGTNSLLELLRRADRGKYHFLVVVYHDYARGDTGHVTQALRELGIDVVHLPQRRPPVFLKIAKEAVRALFFFSQRAIRMGVFLIDYLWRVTPNARALEELIRSARVDLLYLNNQPSSNLEGLIAAHRAGVPVVQHARKTTTLNVIERKLTRAWLTKMICVSEGVRETYAGQGIPAQRCVVVHNGIDLAGAPSVTAGALRASLGIAPDACVIGTVCSLIPLKRVDVLLSAVARLRAGETRPLYCLIVGDGPELPRLRALADTLGLRDTCRFVGFQPDALSYIGALDIFVLASAQEGLPRTVLEAMLLGRPVVASDVTGTRELVMHGETGYLFPSGDVDALANCLHALIHDETLRARLGMAGKQRVAQHFSIERYVQGVERELDEIVAKCRTSF